MTERPVAEIRIYDEPPFRNLFAREIQRATRYQDFLSLCVVYPEVRQAPGHVDRAVVARRIAELLRFTDLVGLVDEDIAILLIHTPDNEATAVMGRLRGRVEAEAFRFVPQAPAIGVRLSLGFAFFPTDATSAATLLSQAQSRLAEARQRER